MAREAGQGVLLPDVDTVRHSPVKVSHIRRQFDRAIEGDIVHESQAKSPAPAYEIIGCSIAIFSFLAEIALA